MVRIGYLSITFFVISVLFYFISMYVTGDVLPGGVSILLMIILPIVGLVLAFKAKGGIKVIGILGNSLVLLLAVVIPSVSSVFWNTP